MSVLQQSIASDLSSQLKCSIGLTHGSQQGKCPLTPLEEEGSPTPRRGK